MGSPGARKATTVTVRFLDDEIMEGQVGTISLNQPNIELEMLEASNNERALVPLPSIKRITLAAGAPSAEEQARAERKVAIRFQDGEVLKGYLDGALRQASHGLTLRLIVGCSALPSVHGLSLGTASPLPAPYQPEPARHEGGTLVVGDWESPTNFSPLFNEEVPAAQIDALLYASLVRLDANLQPVPDLVQRVPTLQNGDVTWDHASGTMDVTYRLRPGLRWSDGQPLTAHDVAFTWKLIVDPKVPGVLSPDGYTAISRIDIHDPQRFTLHFDRVYPKYLTLFPAVLPEHRLGAVSPEQLPGDPFWARPDVVSGPFKISELVPDSHITLVRNDAWSQGRSGRRPHLDSIIDKIYPEAGQLREAARSAQVAVALELPDDQLAALSVTGAMTVQRRSQLAYEQVTFNQADPNPLTGQAPLWKNDPALLQALRLAIDRA